MLNSGILHIQQELELHEAGFRKTPSTTLINDQAGEVVCVPRSTLMRSIKQLMMSYKHRLRQEIPKVYIHQA